MGQTLDTTSLWLQACQFLRVGFAEHDRIALLVREVGRRTARQRLGNLSWACSNRVEEWLARSNASGYDVLASVNVVLERAQSRAKADIAAVRHVIVDIDSDAGQIVGAIGRRPSLPLPSVVVHTSRERAHVLWRVRDFDAVAAEQLQRWLAAGLGGDRAATSVTQLTRLPGFWNHKHDEPYLVWAEYLDIDRVCTPRDFPRIECAGSARSVPAASKGVVRRDWASIDRAISYLSRVPPAVAGQHGDLHTFQTCCRIVRGFALDDDQAFAVLADWNARCQPPWTERGLLQKIRSARRNGREPIGGLL